MGRRRPPCLLQDRCLETFRSRRRRGLLEAVSGGTRSVMGRDAATGAPHQTPYRRVYASGKAVWVARFYDLEGRARYAKPRWHGYKSSFALRRDAQRAIDEAL